MLVSSPLVEGTPVRLPRIALVRRIAGGDVGSTSASCNKSLVPGILNFGASLPDTSFLPKVLRLALRLRLTMGLYKNLPDDIQEVDVIIAGGKYPCSMNSCDSKY